MKPAAVISALATTLDQLSRQGLIEVGYTTWCPRCDTRLTAADHHGIDEVFILHDLECHSNADEPAGDRS